MVLSYIEMNMAFHRKEPSRSGANCSTLCTIIINIVVIRFCSLDHSVLLQGHNPSSTQLDGFHLRGPREPPRIQVSTFAGLMWLFCSFVFHVCDHSPASWAVHWRRRLWLRTRVARPSVLTDRCPDRLSRQAHGQGTGRLGQAIRVRVLF